MYRAGCISLGINDAPDFCKRATRQEEEPGAVQVTKVLATWDISRSHGGN
jgi:hypothetical protein